MTEPEFRWTQDSFDPEDEVRDRPRSARNNRLTWFGVLALAFIVFELTADPAISTALGCLKFGWGEVHLARWLKKTDPDRRRGKICSRFYLAWGLWRVSLVATAVAFILVFTYVKMEEKLGKPQGINEPPASFNGAFLLALVGFLSSSAVSSLAVISALRYRVKVWVGPEVRWAREEGVWPPHVVVRRRFTENRTKPILLSALITGLMFTILVIVLPLSFAFPHDLSPALSIAIVMVIIIGTPILMMALLEMLGARMIAQTPEECWADPIEIATFPG